MKRPSRVGLRRNRLSNAAAGPGGSSRNSLPGAVASTTAAGRRTPRRAAPRQPAAQQRKSLQKTYYGEVAKQQNGKFALVIDVKAQRGYFLDDQKDAAKFEKKKVLVTGTVDPKTSVLHVVKIKPVP